MLDTYTINNTIKKKRKGKIVTQAKEGDMKKKCSYKKKMSLIRIVLHGDPLEDQA